MTDFTYEAFHDADGNLIDERFTDHGPRLMVAADIGIDEREAAWLGPFHVGSASWDFYLPGDVSNLRVSRGRMRPTETDMADWIGRKA